MKRKWLVFVGMLVVAIALFIAQDGFAQKTLPLKVTIIFDIGGREDGGFNESAYRGLEKAVAELGVKAAYLEPGGSLDRESALDIAAASDADMVIGVGFVFSDRMNALAAIYPDKKFVCVDYSVRYDHQGRVQPFPENLSALLFKEEEGSFLVGAIAALKSRTGKIGFLGGMDSPIIRKFQSGYLAGAQSVRPDIRVLSKFAGITARAFNNPRKGYQIAERMYGQGADVIYHAAGVTGAGLFQAAKKRRRLAIGVDIDQSGQAPGFVLTSMTKHVDVAVFESIKAAVEGKFASGIKTFGLKENGVGFVYDELNRGLISADIHKTVLALKEKIISEELTVPATEEKKRLLSRSDLLEALSELKEEVGLVLNKLDADLKHAAKMLSGRQFTDERTRFELKQILGANPYLIDCAAISDKGILLAVEPEEFNAIEGADIHTHAHWGRLVKTKKPVMSASFRSVEGIAAVSCQHPVFSPANRFAGSVSALFAPENLLSSIIKPVSMNLPFEVFLMQTDGLMLFDVDPAQIGRNVFTDPLYQPFPELLALAGKVAANKEGSGAYRFPMPGVGTPVAKQAYWKTIGRHGAEWRIVITCAQDSIRK